MSWLRRTFLLTALLVLALALPAPGAEVITQFHSEVLVDTDGTISVTETISVIAEGKDIKRGIFRDFPTRYERRDGTTVEVPFKVLSVTRDDHDEPWTTQGMSNGIRVRIGSADDVLSTGEHRYTISYTTGRQIGFFEDHDELYWNATGNGWGFPIKKASCRINLPKGAEILQLGAWTGYEGSKDRDAKMTSEDSNVAYFHATRTLKPGEGLTVAVSWPKDIVTQPAGSAFFVSDHGLEMTFVATALAGFAFFLWAWFKVGKDPEKGTVIPRFTPPDGVSPAGSRQISIMGFDDKSFSAAIVSLAVKGYLIISEEEGLFKKYLLKKTPENKRKAPLEEEEKRLFPLLLGSRDSLLLEDDNHEIIGGARDALEDTLQSAYGHLYSRNTGYSLLGILLMGLILGPGTLLMGHGEDEIALALGTTVAALVSGLFFSFTIRDLRRKWMEKSGFRALMSATAKIVVLSVLALVFGMALIVGAGFLPTLCTASIPIIALVPAIFIPLLGAPTVEGRAMMDEIEGFAMYLKVAEEDRLNMLNPPDKTPELFERYLPYAMALGLEQAWGEKFATALAATEGSDAAYSPAWYAGTAPLHVGSMGSFASGLGSSFSSVVSSSATAPGSSSAFSGDGGSSGGGGGGGGGGGW